MLVNYMELSDGTVIKHSLRLKEFNGRFGYYRPYIGKIDMSKNVIVHIETPDDVHFFKEADISIPNLIVEHREGYTDEELSKLVSIVKNNMDAILEYSTIGGIKYA